MDGAAVLLIAQAGTGGSLSAGTLALIAVLFLIILLIQKELSGVLSGRYKKLSQALNVAIVPIFIALILVVLLKWMGMIP